MVGFLSAPFILTGQAFDPLSIWTGGRTGVHIIPTPTTTGVAVGAAVASLTDQSPGGLTVEQSVSASRPVLRQNGSGGYYLEFGGVDDWLEIPALTLGATVSLYFALTNANQTSGGSIHRPFLAALSEDTYFTGGSTTYGVGLSRDGSDAIRFSLGHVADFDQMVYALATGGENVVIRVTNEATAADLTVDGISRDATTTTRTSGFGAGYALGAHPPQTGLSRAYAGHIYGAILVNDTLTADEDAGIRAYLSSLFTGGA